MKKITLFILLLSLACAARAQDFPSEQVIEPYRVEVTYAKTLHILFPSAVKYIDLGSADLIAAKAPGAENVVRIKSAVKGFEGETNFSVITEDGCFYSFDARYSSDPAQLSIEMEDWLRKDPYSPFANRQMYIRLSELGNETPLVVNRILYTIYKKDARDIKSIGSRKFGIEAALKGIYVHGNLYFLHVSFQNLTRVGFDVDYIRFKVQDKKVARRTAMQETFVKPLRVFNDVVSVEARSTARTVYTFKKFTIPDDKVLVMEIYEKNGGRHQSFRIEHTDLVSAREINELKLK